METAESFKQEVEMEVSNGEIEKKKMSVGEELKGIALKKETQMLVGNRETESAGLGSQNSGEIVVKIKETTPIKGETEEIRMYTVGQEYENSAVCPGGIKKKLEIQIQIKEQTSAEVLQAQGIAVGPGSINKETVVEITDEKCTVKQNLFTAENMMTRESVKDNSQVNIADGENKKLTGEQSPTQTLVHVEGESKDREVAHLSGEETCTSVSGKEKEQLVDAACLLICPTVQSQLEIENVSQEAATRVVIERIQTIPSAGGNCEKITHMDVEGEEMKELKVEQTASLILATSWEKGQLRAINSKDNADAPDSQITEFTENQAAAEIQQVLATARETSKDGAVSKVGMKRKLQMEVSECVAEQTPALALGENQSRSVCIGATDSFKKARTVNNDNKIEMFTVEQASSRKSRGSAVGRGVSNREDFTDIGKDEWIQELPSAGEELEGNVNVANKTAVDMARRKWRSEVGDGEVKEFTVEQLAEYQWPVNRGGEHLMIQEQVTEYLAVKSFKRRYPNLRRRPVETEEKAYLLENDLVSEAMCDMGLTAVLSSEILDVMYADFQEKYEEYRSFVRDRQNRELNVKQKASGGLANVDKNKQDYKEKAVSSAAKWNAKFNKARKDGRRCCFDLQTFTIHFPWHTRLKMIPEQAPKIGCYPVAFVPGQFQDCYKYYTPAELRYFPLNTVLYGPVKPNEWKPLSRGSDESQSDSSDSSSSDNSGSTSSEDTDSTTSEETDIGDEQDESKCNKERECNAEEREMCSRIERICNSFQTTGSANLGSTKNGNKVREAFVPPITASTKKVKSSSVVSNKISHKVELSKKLELELKSNFKKFSNRFSKIWLPETLK